METSTSYYKDKWEADKVVVFCQNDFMCNTTTTVSTNTIDGRIITGSASNTIRESFFLYAVMYETFTL